MSMRLAIDNEPVRRHESALPALHGIADTILEFLSHGRIDGAVRFMSGQRLPPIALGFVAASLVRRGVGQKDIEAVLLH